MTASGLAAEPAAPSKEPASLQFRRVYVPEGVKDWPKGDAKYLPMDAREFERLIGQIQRKSTRLPTQSATGFTQSQFECRLNGQSLLQGSGTLDVSPAIASGMLMTLEPCNLAIDRASGSRPTAHRLSSEHPVTAICRCWRNAPAR